MHPRIRNGHQFKTAGCNEFLALRAPHRDVAEEKAERVGPLGGVLSNLDRGSLGICNLSCLLAELGEEVVRAVLVVLIVLNIVGIVTSMLLLLRGANHLHHQADQ